MAKKLKKMNRIFWIDALRVLSIFMVVALHSSAKVIYSWDLVVTDQLSAISWNFANLINSFSRASVPLFVLLSGALLLEKKETTEQFLNKRLPRILLPWFFWGTIQLFYNFDFSLKAILSGNLTDKIAATYFGGFWFMPMILGLYLITPFIKPFIQNAKPKEFLYLFSLWFIFACLIPTLNTLFGISISYQLPIFIQYLGYFVSGYFLTQKIKLKDVIMSQTKLLYVISTLIIALGTYALTKLDSNFNSALYEYLNLPVFISAITGFLTFKSLFENKKLLKIIRVRKIKNKIQKISTLSFGIFLSHSLILDIFTKGKMGLTIHGMITNPFFAVPLTTILIFATSCLVTLLLSKYFKQFVS